MQCNKSVDLFISFHWMSFVAVLSHRFDVFYRFATILFFTSLLTTLFAAFYFDSKQAESAKPFFCISMTKNKHGGSWLIFGTLNWNFVSSLPFHFGYLTMLNRRMKGKRVLNRHALMAVVVCCGCYKRCHSFFVESLKINF